MRAAVTPMEGHSRAVQHHGADPVPSGGVFDGGAYVVGVGEEHPGLDPRSHPRR